MTVVRQQPAFGSGVTDHMSGGGSMPSGRGEGGPRREQEPTRRPEVSEARNGLQAAVRSRDASKVMDAVRRVIVFMTMGVDMSPLYSDMIMAINTRDITQKKLIYMYLCEYGKKHSELTLLAMNTLAKDCADASPIVRGVAVRALGSFGLKSLLEYIVPLISTALDDVHPYVRRSAIFAAAKLMPIMDVDSSAKLVTAIERLVNDTDTILLVGQKSSICVSAKEIPALGRTSIGNQILKGTKVIGVSKI